MKIENNQKGFSLIELLVVVTIIGIIAAISISYYRQAISASENSSAFAFMKKLITTESTFYTQNNRYGRLQELNNMENGILGQMSGNTLVRGKFSYETIPAAPTNSELTNFTIKATRVIDSNLSTYVLQVDQSGNITQLAP